ncbi:hypothetical protein [Lichenifustis flavocetrariae]|uniref:Uncharacterized protein n=1 Tax=Lichenifustis flavocetrariae TaxID=2949735 RepID=A0AA41Z6Q8_9HYPH|nr:hypothetical protein [Lichenifustis flavocetrariae]MCW6511365.1 hypothetical protein [Lichenifustis flavocetrariae]
MTIISGGFGRKLPAHSPRGEADRLLGIWGDTAYDVARNLSMREDAGLLQTASPGFWANVVREIGHQMGIPDAPVLGAHHFVI